MNLSTCETAIVINGLRAAADLYDKDAETMQSAGQMRLEAQFMSQAHDARALAARFELES